MSGNGALTLADLKAVGAAKAVPHEIDGQGTVYIRPLPAGLAIQLAEDELDVTDPRAWPYMIAEGLVDANGNPMCGSIEEAREVLDALPQASFSPMLEALMDISLPRVKEQMGKSPSPARSDSPST